jgi:hypothetical protein
MINPCTGQPFLQVDEKGNQTNTDMCGSAPCGHVAVIAAEAGTPRTLDCPMPPDCPTGQFDNRVVFYWLSDPNFPYATPATLTILRRAPLWALGYLDSPNRSDVPFKRGDFDDNGEVNITDAVSTFNFLFLGGGPPHCMDAADANDTEDVDISDGVFSLNFLFLGGRRIPSPFVNAYQGCALDFTPAPSEAEVKNPDSILPCASYDSCAN